MSPTEHLLDIDPYVGAPMTLRAVPPQQGYPYAPRIDCAGADGLRIEFYDRSFVSEPDFQPYGQFIGSLCAQTLAQDTRPGPLILKSIVPQWWIDADTMRQVRAWAAEQCERQAA
ncbi:hypothetical protein [Castellaniella sp.]|uniref:hypothetical protein n=1 Tax=Castellaniella sp. TaxID=1955812 RepID=UPI0035695EC8